jgi:hypothetical protein
MPRNPDDPSLPGWLLYRFFHVPLAALRERKADFALYLLCGRRVRSGPFAGLRYVGTSPNPHIGPALLGTYELEIQPFMRRLLDGDFDVFVDIGAAVAQKLEMRGFCDPAELAATLQPFRRPALLVDIEGYEAAVLDPGLNPHLARTTMLVELHEHEQPMAEILRARFAPTHAIEEVWTRPRTAEDLPARLGLARWFFPNVRLLQFADETRGREMRWWLLTPKSAP